MQKKWDRAAMRFASAKYDSRREILDVKFENGESFHVATEFILPVRPVSATANSAAPLLPKWSKMRIGETGDVLEVPAGDILIEIPWDRIRSIADPEFRAHWVDSAVERCHRLGSRIRELRLESGLSRVALAEKLGVARDMVAQLEAGKMEAPPDFIERIAVALGRPLGDFAQE